MRDAARADALARREVAVAVEDDLVAVRASCAGTGTESRRVEVDEPRHEAADQRAARGERAVPRRRQVHRRHARLEREDRERPRIDRAVPADDVERRVLDREAVPACRRGARRARGCLSSYGARELRALEVALLVRRVHAELADLVAPLLREVQAAVEREPEPVLLAPRRDEAVQQAARHEHVVALRERDVAEQRAQRAAALVDVDQLVGVAVDDVDRILGGRKRDAAR